MTQFSLANLYGITLRESANDGSDFTNPDADYRRVFLGEDGLIHLKDSAGAVTTPQAGSGAITGSGLTMATARLLGRTSASTGAVEEITVGSGLSLAAGSLTATGSGTNLNPGTSFPGSPSNNDLCYRTDRDILYFYDGTRWLSLNLYRGGDSLLVGSTTTSGQVVSRWAPWHTTYDMWLVSLLVAAYVATTNTGSAYWTIAGVKYQSNFSTSAAAGSVNTSANSPNVMVTSDTAIGALFDPTTYKVLQVEATKTGSPGALSVAAGFTYRLVG